MIGKKGEPGEREGTELLEKLWKMWCGKRYSWRACYVMFLELICTAVFSFAGRLVLLIKGETAGFGSVDVGVVVIWWEDVSGGSCEKSGSSIIGFIS